MPYQDQSVGHISDTTSQPSQSSSVTHVAGNIDVPDSRPPSAPDRSNHDAGHAQALSGSDSESSQNTAAEAKFAAKEAMRTAEAAEAALHDDTVSIGEIVAFNIAAENAQNRLDDLMDNHPDQVLVETVAIGSPSPTIEPVRLSYGIDSATGEYLGTPPGELPSVGQVFQNIVSGRSQSPDPRLDGMTDADINDLEVSQQVVASTAANTIVFGVSGQIDDLAGQYAPGPLKVPAALAAKVLTARVVNPVAQEASDIYSDYQGDPNVVPGPGWLSKENLVYDIAPSATSIVAGQAAGGLAKTAVLGSAAAAGIAVPEPVTTILGLGTAIYVGSKVFVATDNLQSNLLPGHVSTEPEESVTPPTLEEFLATLDSKPLSEQVIQPNDGYPLGQPVADNLDQDIDNVFVAVVDERIDPVMGQSDIVASLAPADQVVFHSVRSASSGDDSDGDSNGLPVQPLVPMTPEQLDELVPLCHLFDLPHPRCYVGMDESSCREFLCETLSEDLVTQAAVLDKSPGDTTQLVAWLTDLAADIESGVFDPIQDPGSMLMATLAITSGPETSQSGQLPLSEDDDLIPDEFTLA